MKHRHLHPDALFQSLLDGLGLGLGVTDQEYLVLPQGEQSSEPIDTRILREIGLEGRPGAPIRRPFPGQRLEAR